jgi:hypothetical protein
MGISYTHLYGTTHASFKGTAAMSGMLLVKGNKQLFGLCCFGYMQRDNHLSGIGPKKVPIWQSG